MILSRNSARVFLALSLIVLSCSPKGGGSSGGIFGSGPLVVAPSTPDVGKLEHQMHARLNRDRAKKGLPPLTYDEKLADAARAHSLDMHEKGFFSHDSPRTGSLADRLDRAGLLVAAARENLGEGESVDATEDALLRSPGHHANIMAKDVTHVGIGIVRLGSGSSERLLVTQVFAKPIEEQDPEGAREVLARSVGDARRKAGLRALPPNEVLDRLAQKYVTDVADDLDKSASQRIGENVTQELEKSGLSSVAVATSVFITPELYQPHPDAVSGRAKALGLATAAAKDERGRPAIKLLLLVGY